MEEAMITRLNAAPAITALTGSRISWFGRVRGDPLPALTLNIISAGRQWTHEGPDNLDHPRVQFDCWAETDLQALALARAVRAELEQATDVAGWRFHPAMQDGEGWTHAGEQDGGSPLFQVSRDFFFYHEPL